MFNYLYRFTVAIDIDYNIRLSMVAFLRMYEILCCLIILEL